MTKILGGTIEVGLDDNPIIRLRLEGEWEKFRELADALDEGRRTLRQKALLADLAAKIRQSKHGGNDEKSTEGDDV